MRAVLTIFCRKKQSLQIQRQANVILSLATLWCMFCLEINQAWSSPVRSYEQQLEQVRLYVNNNMFEAARNELLKLSQTQNGERDERLFTALAKVNFKLNDITQALSYLRTARSLSSNAQNKEKLSQLYEQWLSTYGLVRFESVDQLQEGRITLVRKRKILNKDRMAALEHVQREFEKSVKLPISVYLPYGQYSANGTSFKLQRNAPTPIVELLLTPLPQAQKEPTAQSDFPWLYVGLGSAAVIALGTGIYWLSKEEPSAPQTLTITITDGR